MKVRVVYHKGKGSWIGKGIVAYTWLLAVVRLDFKSLKYNFGHVSWWFPDEDYGKTHNCVSNGFIAEKTGGSDKFNFHRIIGQCFSSTTRGDAKGVRFAPASEVLHNPSRWMYQEYEVSEVMVKRHMHRFRAKVGRPYDFDMIKGFLLPWEKGDPDAEICSELCGWVAWILDIVRLPAFGKWVFKISPRRLAKVLGGELHELKQCS